MQDEKDDVKENNVAETKSQSPYPWETIASSIEMVKSIIQDRVVVNPLTRKEISIITGRSESSLTMRLSTAGQYGLMENVFGKGYVLGGLFNKFNEPVFENDERKAMLLMFNEPPLYKKLIEELNGKGLPNESGLSNHLKNVYKLNPNSAERAAKVFLENVRNLNIADGNRLRYILPDGSNDEKRPPKIDPPAGNGFTPLHNPPAQDDLFELPIPLPNKRKAYLKYPLDNLTRKDILVITKALEFIASSLDDEEPEIKKE